MTITYYLYLSGSCECLPCTATVLSYGAHESSDVPSRTTRVGSFDFLFIEM